MRAATNLPTNETGYLLAGVVANAIWYAHHQEGDYPANAVRQHPAKYALVPVRQPAVSDASTLI